MQLQSASTTDKSICARRLLRWSEQFVDREAFQLLAYTETALASPTYVSVFQWIKTALQDKTLTNLT